MTKSIPQRPSSNCHHHRFKFQIKDTSHCSIGKGKGRVKNWLLALRSKKWLPGQQIQLVLSNFRAEKKRRNYRPNRLKRVLKHFPVTRLKRTLADIESDRSE